MTTPTTAQLPEALADIIVRLIGADMLIIDHELDPAAGHRYFLCNASVLLVRHDTSLLLTDTEGAIAAPHAAANDELRRYTFAIAPVTDSLGAFNVVELYRDGAFIADEPIIAE